MGEWENLLAEFDKNHDTTKALELLDRLKPFVKEESVKKRLIGMLLNFDDRLIRIKVTELFEELDSADSEVINALIMSVNSDPDAFVRGFSAKVLGKLGDVRAIEALKRAQEDEDGFVRHYAGEALKILEMKTRLLSVIQRAKGG